MPARSPKPEQRPDGKRELLPDYGPTDTAEIESPHDGKPEAGRGGCRGRAAQRPVSRMSPTKSTRVLISPASANTTRVAGSPRQLVKTRPVARHRRPLVGSPVLAHRHQGLAQPAPPRPAQHQDPGLNGGQGSVACGRVERLQRGGDREPALGRSQSTTCSVPSRLQRKRSENSSWRESAAASGAAGGGPVSVTSSPGGRGSTRNELPALALEEHLHCLTARAGRDQDAQA